MKPDPDPNEAHFDPAAGGNGTDDVRADSDGGVDYSAGVEGVEDKPAKPEKPCAGVEGGKEFVPEFVVGDQVFVPEPHKKVGVVTKVNKNGTYAVRYE